MFKLLVATNNQHKVHEYKEMFKNFPIEVYCPKDLNIVSDPVEDGDSYEANSLIKARALQAYTDMPIIADDSGLSVNALDGFPGIYSSRFASENGGNITANPKLIEKLQPFSDKSASFICVITLLNVKPEPIQFRGECPGHILPVPIGDGGFGYDPIFYSDEAKQAFGTCSEEIKNKYSHRAKALKKLTDYLKENGLI